MSVPTVWCHIKTTKYMRVWIACMSDNNRRGSQDAKVQLFKSLSVRRGTFNCSERAVEETLFCISQLIFNLIDFSVSLLFLETPKTLKAPFSNWFSNVSQQKGTKSLELKLSPRKTTTNLSRTSNWIPTHSSGNENRPHRKNYLMTTQKSKCNFILWKPRKGFCSTGQCLCFDFTNQIGVESQNIGA